MQVMGVAPNEHTFSALIDGYGKKGRVEKAEAALRDMLKAGFSMNLVAYTSIIDAYGSAKMFKVRWWQKKCSYYPSHSFLLACDLFFFVNYK